jgi:tetratricopeptide (TPR) repeat protein
MIDKSSILKAAQKHLSKGNIDKAIAEYEKIAGAYPDGNSFNLIGDLYLKKGDKKTAAEIYHKAAKHYMDEGFTLKAIAIFKKILNVSPSDSTALISLGELSEEKAVTTDAIKYYLAAADILSKENKKDELINVYSRILNLAPKNINLRAKIAELFSKEAFVREAAKEYFNIGQLYLEEGDMESARTFLIKSMEIQPNNKETLLELSRLSEKTGDLSQARNYIEITIERTGESSDLLLRNAHLLAEAGSFDAAAESIKKILESDSSNIDARKELAYLYEKTGNREKAWKEYVPIIENLIENERVEEAITLLISYKDLDPIENRKKLVLYCKQIGNEEQTVKELIDLQEAYLTFGMQDEATGCLKEVLEIQPFNLAIKEKVEAMEGVKAPKSPEPAAETEADGPAKPEEWPSTEPEPQLETPEPEEGAKEEWPSMEPEPQFEAPEPEEGAKEEWPPPETEQKPETFEPDQAEGFGKPMFSMGDLATQFMEEEEGEKSIEELLTEADVFLKYGLYGDAKNLLEKLKVEDPQNVDVHLKLKTLYTDTNDVEQSVTECIILSTLASRSGDEEKSSAYLMEAFEMNPADPRLEGRIPEEMIKRAPAAAETEEKVEEPEPELSTAAPSGEPTESVGESTELTGEEFEDFTIPDLNMEDVQEPELDTEVADIFEEFKKGLEKEIEEEDVETHYNLGIAYKEMGLLDDSINQFQTSKLDPKYFVQSMSMLGICYMEKGLYPLAIDSFSGALMKVEKTDDTSWCIKYDLAEAYEKTEKLNEALELYTQVYGWNAKFRDVAQRVTKLRDVTGTKEKPKSKKSRVSYI